MRRKKNKWIKKLKKFFKRKKRKRKSIVKKIVQKINAPKPKFKEGETVRVITGNLFGAIVDKIEKITIKRSEIIYIINGNEYPESELRKNVKLFK